MSYPKIICFVVSSFLALTALAAPLWSRGGFATQSHDLNDTNTFSMVIVEQEGLHLTGLCSYRATEKSKRMAISGTDTGDAGFWPDVTAQVRNDQTGQWQTVASPFTRGHRSTIEVDPGTTTKLMPVTLDVFLPLVAKYKVGRVVLPTGEAAVFELEILLEPGVDTTK